MTACPRDRFCLLRWGALCLALSLALPCPAFALRGETVEGAGLEELDRALRLAPIEPAPAAGLESRRATNKERTVGDAGETVSRQKSEAPEAGWVRARVLTGPGPTYDAIVLDQLPTGMVPELEGGLSALLGQLNAEGPFTWVDGMGGLGAALLEARGLYPNMNPVLVDQRAWRRDQQDPATLLALEQQAQARGVDFWQKGDLPFIQEDMLRVDLRSLQGPPIRLVTMLNALHYNANPLAILENVYNQLPEGALLLTNLYIPTEHPRAEALAKFYDLLFTGLKAQGIADFRLTDLRRMDGVQLNNQLETGSFPEFALGIVLKKGPGRLSLQADPVSAPFEVRTPRPVVYEVAWYGEDPSVFTYSSPATGLEEVDPLVKEAIAGLFPLPDDFRRVVWLGERMALMDLRQLEQLVAHLFWVADRKEVGEVLMRALGSNAPPAPRVLSALWNGLGFLAAKGHGEGYHALRAVLSHLDPASRKQFSEVLFHWLKATDPNRQGPLKDLPLHLDEANMEAGLLPAWAGLPARLLGRIPKVQAQEWSAHYEAIGMTYFLGSDHYRSKRQEPLEAQWRAEMTILALSVMGQLNPRRAGQTIAEWRQKIPARLNQPGIPNTLAGIWASGTHPEAKRSVVSQAYGRLAGFLGSFRDSAAKAPGQEMLGYRVRGHLMHAEKLYADYLALWSRARKDDRMEEEASKHYVLARQYQGEREQIKEQKLKALGLAAGMEEYQAAFGRLMEEDGFRRELEEKGWVALGAERLRALGGPAMAWGMIVRESARIQDRAHAVIADEELVSGPEARDLPWIEAGSGMSQVIRNAAGILRARPGDLILVKREEGVTRVHVARLLKRVGLTGERAVRTAIGTEEQVRALPLAAFQVLASGADAGPQVVRLDVEVLLQDEAGNTYRLILMA